MKINNAGETIEVFYELDPNRAQGAFDHHRSLSSDSEAERLLLVASQSTLASAELQHHLLQSEQPASRDEVCNETLHALNRFVESHLPSKKQC